MNTKLSIIIGSVIVIIVLGIAVRSFISTSPTPIKLKDSYCDADTLNATLTYWEGKDLLIRDQIPAHCAEQAQQIRYVGIPEKGGYWVKAEDYAERQKAWEQHRK